MSDLTVKLTTQNSIHFFIGAEIVIKLEEGYFWYKGERIEDVHKVYERFTEWLKQAEDALKPVKQG